MEGVNNFRSVSETVHSGILRFNRNGTVSMENYSKKIPVYRVPASGCYRVAGMGDMLMVYLLYNVSYLLYIRAKHYIEHKTYEKQNLSAVLCARIGIMFNELFSRSGLGEYGERHDVMLSLSGDEQGAEVAGILLEITNDNGRAKAQVSLTESMDEAVRELYDTMQAFTPENFPKNIGNFYDTVLATKGRYVDFSKIIKPNILVERVMNEHLPAIYNSSLSEALSADYISNLSLKSYLIANQNIVPMVLQSKELSPRAFMNKLFRLTRDTFSERLGGTVTEGKYGRDELYKMLMANMLFSTASKYRRVILVESLRKYVDDTAESFAEFVELIEQNKTTMFYT